VRKSSGAKLPTLHHLGLEYIPIRNISLRLGVFGESFSEKRKVNYTSGLGYTRESNGLDFAPKRYYPDGIQIQAPVYSYVCSLSVPF
jgi:hypothetical protein